MLKNPTLKRKKMMMEVDQDGEEEKMEVEESETKRSRANEEESSNYSLETVKHGFQFVSLAFIKAECTVLPEPFTIQARL